MDEQDSFREHIDDYDAKFPRGSCRLDAQADRIRYAQALPEGILGLRKAPAIHIDLTTPGTTTTTTTSSTSPATTRSGRTRRRPTRLQFFTNVGEHELMRRLRQDDPELYELKLFEWDYMASLGDDEAEPDLDITQAPEVMFTIGVTVDEPTTAATSVAASQLRGGAHHQSSTSGTAGNYKIYSGQDRAGFKI